MDLTRVVMLIDFESAARVSAFLSSDDIRRGKFGDLGPVDASAPHIRQLIQPDGYRITLIGRQIQINYDLPNEARAEEENPIAHAEARWKRTVSTLSALQDGKAEWVGIQFVFEEPDPEATSQIHAAQNWAKRVKYNVDGVELSGLNFNLAVRRGDFYESIIVQAFENRGGFVQPSDMRTLDIEKMKVMGAGMQYIVDVNTKPRSTPTRVSDLVVDITRHVRERHKEIVQRGIDAITTGRVHV